MKAKRWLIAFACLVAMGAVSKAQEGPQCGPRSELVKVLAEQYQESPRVMGVINGQRIMELFASDKGTWTFIITSSDGRSCLLGSGDNFELVVPKELKPGEDL